MSAAILHVYSVSVIENLTQLVENNPGLQLDLDAVQMCSIELSDYTGVPRSTKKPNSFFFHSPNMSQFSGITWYTKVVISVMDIELSFFEFSAWIAKSLIYLDGEPIAYDDLIDTYRPDMEAYRPDMEV